MKKARVVLTVDVELGEDARPLFSQLGAAIANLDAKVEGHIRELETQNRPLFFAKTSSEETLYSWPAGEDEAKKIGTLSVTEIS